MKKIVKKIINQIVSIDNEPSIINLFITQLGISKQHRLLDVGCGYGKNLRLLHEHGLNVLGVEINESIVEINKKSGLPCCSVKEFHSNNEVFDLILMSHVIEHFAPAELLKFLESYLCKLKKGGYLILATPLMSSYFYDDFDHVKPYQPTGINMMFCSDDAQVQYRSKFKLQCMDIWFRRSPFRRVFGSDIYSLNKFPSSTIINLFYAILYRFSVGLFGQTDGWIGIYKKVQ